MSARTGAPAQSVRHARQAEDSLSTRGEDPEWFVFFDPTRLAGFLGYSQLVTGQTADAIVSLGRALDHSTTVRTSSDPWCCSTSQPRTSPLTPSIV